MTVELIACWCGTECTNAVHVKAREHAPCVTGSAVDVIRHPRTERVVGVGTEWGGSCTCGSGRALEPKLPTV